MAVLSYYYFREKTNDDALTLCAKRDRAKALKHNVSWCTYDCMWLREIYAHTYTFLSLLLFVFLLVIDITWRTENIETPYVFPETV